MSLSPKPTLSSGELEHYSRQIILKDLGTEGQLKLKASSVLIVGAGALGSIAAMVLTGAGVGKITLLDYDRVDASNLHRQFLYTSSDIGQFKVKVLKQRLEERNPHIHISAIKERFKAANAIDFIRPHDFIIDGTDSLAAKFLINDACVLEQKAFSHAGVLGFDGQTMTVVPASSACLRCLFPEAPPVHAVPRCSEAGILGGVSSVIGSIQAMEAIRFIVQKGELLTNMLLSWNALDMNFRRIKLKRQKDWVLGAPHPFIRKLEDGEEAECDLNSDKDSKEVACGEDRKEVACGEDRKEVACGEDRKEVACGEDRKEVVGGNSTVKESENFLISFPSSQVVIQAERRLKKENIQTSPRTTPRQLSSECSICLEIHQASPKKVFEILKSQEVEWVRHLSLKDLGSYS